MRLLTNIDKSSIRWIHILLSAHVPKKCRTLSMYRCELKEEDRYIVG